MNVFIFRGTLQCGRTVKVTEKKKHVSGKHISGLQMGDIFPGRYKSGKMLGNFNCTQSSLITVVNFAEGHLYFLWKKWV